MKHSAGKWSVFNWRGQSTIIQNEKGQAIADCDVNRYLDMATKEANAKLMASAPELLAALKSIVSYGNPPINAIAIAAINKATE